MKSIILRITLLVFITSLVSCSKPKSFSVIPKDTNMVTVIDAYSLLKKADLGSLEDLKLIKKFNTELKNENKKAAKIFKKIKKDPFITGVDFFKDIFVFYTEPDERVNFAVTTATLKNASKFTDFIQQTFTDLDLDNKIVLEGNHKYIKLDRSSYLAWDDNKLININALNHRSRKEILAEITRLFTLGEVNQITTNEDFNQFYKNKKDISVYLSSNALQENRDFKQLEKMANYDLKDNTVKLYLDFEDDAINLQSNVALNKSLRKMMADYKIFDTDFNTDLLDFIPKKHLATGSIAINPMAYYGFLKTQKDYQKVNEEVERAVNISTQKLFEALGGSVVYNWSDVQKQTIQYKKYDYFSSSYTNASRKETVAIISLAFDIKNKETVAQLLAKAQQSEQITAKDNYYSFQFDNKFPAYFAFNDDMFLISNNELTVNQFSHGKPPVENLNDTALKSEMNDNYVFNTITLNTNDYPSDLKNMFFFLSAEKTEGVFDVWNAFASSLDYTQTDNYKANLAIKLKDGKGNSLNRLLRTVDGIYNAAMN